MAKPQKLKARLPRGLADRGPAEIAATRRMTDTIREVFELYGFEPLETPAIEYTDALGKFLPDQDRPNEGVFSFQDDDEQWMSLRYDLTAPLARYVAENTQTLALPYRSYRFGWVFRNEKPGPGRYRQFMQFDADTVGSASPAADAEICMMAADTMERLGIARGQYVVKVNNRKVLDGLLLESIGLSGDENFGTRMTVLRAIDKWDRLGQAGTEALLGAGRKDESGDFTRGAGLSQEQITRVLTLISTVIPFRSEKDWKIKVDDEDVIGDVTNLVTNEKDRYFVDNKDTIDALREQLADSKLAQEGLDELQRIDELWKAGGYRARRVRVDPSIVRGLEYYTGPIFEVELLIETKDEKGRPVRFGSVGGGGRYDGLVSRFRGEPVPATGFSIGVSRLQAALTLIGKLDSKPERGPVVVTVFDKDRIADYQKMVATLREANIRAELYLGNPKHNVGQQLKYADKRNSPCAIIQGGDELNDSAGPQVIVKDLTLGAELSKLETERAGHLERQGEAQQKIPQAKLVEAVKEILARHGAK
jgi:histidyl-tRNA synthetase